MHVAILGAGALGVVFGVRLTAIAKANVTFVVRAEHEGDASPLKIERADHEGDVVELAAPVRTAAIPRDADVVLVCVRAEQLDDALVAQLAAEASDSAPVVVMTPMMPHTFERLRDALRAPGGEARVLAGMPGVVAYRSAPGVFRYWLPRVAATLVDEPRAPVAALDDLVSALETAGISTKLELGVHESNPATTVSFMALAFALDVAGSADALVDDHDLVHLAVEAAHEGGKLAEKIGKTAGWASLLMKFVGPHTLKVGIGLARMRSAEAVRYVEDHFGHKLHAQNVAMGVAMMELAREKDTPHEAIDALVARLKAHAAP